MGGDSVLDFKYVHCVGRGASIEGEDEVHSACMKEMDTQKSYMQLDAGSNDYNRSQHIDDSVDEIKNSERLGKQFAFATECYR
jgi:hypothetical protein